MRLALTLLPLILSLATISSVDRNITWDDEFIFLRYAQNLVDGFGFSFNPALPPTNGVTSLAQLFLGSLPLSFLFGKTAQFLTPWPGLIFWLMCICLFILVMKRAFADVRAGWALTLIATLCVSGLIFSASLNAINGMDTSITCLGGMLICLSMASLLMGGKFRLWPNAVSWSFIFLTYFFRPELLLCASIVASVSFIAIPPTRRSALGIAVFAGAGLLLTTLICKIYFGAPFPLSFYAKTSSVYGPELEQYYAVFARTYLTDYLTAMVPVFLLAWFANFQCRELKQQEISFANIFLAAAIIHIGLTYYFVLPIMGHNSRFMQPAFAPSAIACILYARNIRIRAISIRLKSIWHHAAIHRTVIAITILSIAFFAWRSILAVKSRVIFARESFAPYYWPCIERISSIEHPSIIGASEIGYLGIRFPRSTILDFAGLVSPEALQNNFDIVAMIRTYQPELIYLPHPDYIPMHAKLKGSIFFNEAYTIYQHTELYPSLGVAILKSWSKHDEVHAMIQGFIKDRKSCRTHT